VFPTDNSLLGDDSGDIDGIINPDDDLDSLIKAMTPHDLTLSSSLPLPNRPPSSSFPYGPYQMIDNGDQSNSGSNGSGVAIQSQVIIWYTMLMMVLLLAVMEMVSVMIPHQWY
jgi:hypothetical protein